ncbi:MAG: AMP-binding protein [Acidobacteriia bacterium]|nr:AMP-binding protein [Terriglobia bacterium]
MIEGAQTLGELLFRASDRYVDRAAFVIYDEAISYRTLAERATAMAGYLTASGLVPGDRVAVWLPNGAVFLELAFGCALAGLMFAPMNTRLRSVDAADALRKSGARALFFTQEFLGTEITAFHARAFLDGGDV